MTCTPRSGSRRSCAATAAKSRSSFSRRRSSETSNATLNRPEPNGSTVCTQTPRTWIASRHMVSSVISADSATRVSATRSRRSYSPIGTTPGITSRNRAPTSSPRRTPIIRSLLGFV